MYVFDVAMQVQQCVCTTQGHFCVDICWRVCRLYEELTGVNDEISDLEDRLAGLKDRANTLGKEYMKAKKESEAADKAVSVSLSIPSLGSFASCVF